MNIKLYIQGFVLALAAILTASCNDDLNSIGSEIQPGDDGITIITDTLPVSAGTVMMDNIYARTTSAVLGKYEDPLFGTIKSEYLFEFKGSDNMVFGTGNIQKEDEAHIFRITVDSVQVAVTFLNFVGDSLAPMGVTAYELTSPLTRNFYTNVNPTGYCNMSKPLGQRTYTINDTKKYISSSTGETFRTLTVNVDTTYGKRFVDEYMKNYGEADYNVQTFSNTDSLRKFFPGIYMASTFGSGSLINVNVSSFDIYYTYTYTLTPEDHSTGEARVDTTAHSVFRLVVTPEVIQLNSIQNSFLSPNPLLTDADAVYLKTPAGVCTQLQFPLREIVRKIDAATENNKLTVNAGKLILKGYSERESAFKYDFGRPSAVVLIEKDSVADFFLNPQKRRPDGKTSFYASWSSSTNSYNFTGLSSLITTYRDKIKNNLIDRDPYFWVIPVEADLISSSAGVSIRQVYNYMKPSTAIIRNNPKDLRFSYIYSVY